MVPVSDRTHPGLGRLLFTVRFAPVQVEYQRQALAHAIAQLSCDVLIAGSPSRNVPQDAIGVNS